MRGGYEDERRIGVLGLVDAATTGQVCDHDIH